MMTALIILHDHPLAPGATGPGVTFDASDVRHWQDDAQAGDSVTEVSAGEMLTEQQLLEALLIPSADNIADKLAIWDAGSISAFVKKMNAMAAALGLRSTHYADPSGVDPNSASTASDQALVASRLVASSVVRWIVRQSRLTIPVAGVIDNGNPALGWGGIIGLKGGFSTRAHYCLITAAFRAHHRSLVLSVALGRHTVSDAAQIDQRLLQTASHSLRSYPLTPPGGAVGSLNSSNGSVRLFAPEVPPVAVVWPGLTLTYSLAAVSAAAAASPRIGAVVAELHISAPWGRLASVPLRAMA
jgi:D-alanyl-D-alanine carboxypeptidase (penicillin-binding protein 5/6)